MKIKNVVVNNRKRAIDIETVRARYSLPFSRLELKPSPKNHIVDIQIDKELGSHAVTYHLASGEEASVHVDAFLDYNKDPDLLRNAALHQLTIEAIKFMKRSPLSKQEVIRRLGTSPSQLYRLLDPANYSKSIDEMLRLMSVLGCRVEWKVTDDVA
jgi:hypothetical protein